MSPIAMAKGQYDAVPGDEEAVDEQIPEPSRAHRLRPCFFAFFFIIFCLAIALLSVTFLEYVARSSEYTPKPKPKSCKNPPTRREWRALWPEEQQDYIKAVQCLFHTSSLLHEEGTLYDDFVYVHMWIGRESHNSSSFLPWHRAFLHVYETTLVSKCGYKGLMPYWAWDTDWSTLSNSSIFSPNSTTGFGSDGSPSLPIILPNSGGRCVVDGSFANYTVRYYDMAVLPHCLSRGFIHHETQELGKLSGWHLRPEAMGELVRAPDYEAFEEVVEGLAHNALHWGIRGDFGSWAAANDPIFFLHHAQLDRLWWMWQQEDPKVRLTEYEGKAFNVSSEDARLIDQLSFGGLKELAGLGRGNASVASVMDAAGGCGCDDDGGGEEEERLLCYRY